MTREVLGTVMRELHTLLAMGAAGSLTDSQLLERFLSRPRDESEVAFATLVARHGSMVMNACRPVLRDGHDAEDAFQATFLILVRHAVSVARREQLAGWLYRVAVRTARSAQSRAVRRRARESGAFEESRCIYREDEGRGELKELLNEELERLPEKYRLPVVLCRAGGTLTPGGSPPARCARRDRCQPPSPWSGEAAGSAQSPRLGTNNHRGSGGHLAGYFSRDAPRSSTIRSELRLRFASAACRPGWSRRRSLFSRGGALNRCCSAS